MTTVQMIILAFLIMYLNFALVCYFVRRIEVNLIKLYTVPSTAKFRSATLKKHSALQKSLLKHSLFWPLYLPGHDKKAKK